MEWKKARFKNPADQVWFPGETVIFGIGQGYLNVTPLQLAHMVSIVASRGKSYQPRLVTGYQRGIDADIGSLIVQPVPLGYVTASQASNSSRRQGIGHSCRPPSLADSLDHPNVPEKPRYFVTETVP